jgi:3-oxoacyl-[acyl-carrier protein] reductase
VNRKVIVPVGSSDICDQQCSASWHGVRVVYDDGSEAARWEGADVLLENKNAVIYGGGGSVGGAVARAFAREGAKVFLAGRTLATLDAVAEDIRAAGGVAEAAEVDALDERAVDGHADAIARAGGIDVSFNAIGHGDVHGTPLIDLPLDDFARPVTTAITSLFLTARAAARQMAQRKSGVIMAITATTARKSYSNVGGTGVAFDAIESLCRQWACELGPLGVRVVWLQTTGILDAISETVDVFPDYGTGRGMTRDEFIAWLEGETMLKRLTSLEDVANAAAFIASDRARGMTASAANLTGGSIPTR